MAYGNRDNDMEDWIKVLQNIEENKILKPVGEGWKPMQYYLKESPYGIAKTRTLITKAVKEGAMEKFSGQAKGKRGKTVNMVYYRLVDHP